MRFINKNILAVRVATTVTATVILVVVGNSATAKALPPAPGGLFVPEGSVAIKTGADIAGKVDAVGEIQAPTKRVTSKQSIVAEVKADKPKAPQAPDTPKNIAILVPAAESMTNKKQPVGLATPKAVQMPVAPTMPQMQMPIMVPDMQIKIHRPVMDTNIMQAPVSLEMPTMPQMPMPPELPTSMQKHSMPASSVDTLQQTVNIPVPSVSVEALQ